MVVSNDSDLATSLEMVKAQQRKVIGLVTPGAARNTQGRRPRKASRDLTRHADFIRSIRPAALVASQLPDPIPGTSIRKPAGW